MPLKSVTIDPKIAPDLLAHVHEATGELERVVGDAAGRVGATWTTGLPDADDTETARLTLSDSGVERTGEITDKDFREVWFLRHLLRRLWDDVLAERMRLQWAKVVASLADDGRPNPED
jgi:hypothetical protein